MRFVLLMWSISIEMQLVALRALVGVRPSEPKPEREKVPAGVRHSFDGDDPWQA